MVSPSSHKFVSRKIPLMSSNSLSEKPVKRQEDLVYTVWCRPGSSALTQGSHGFHGLCKVEPHPQQTNVHWRVGDLQRHGGVLLRDKLKQKHITSTSFPGHYHPSLQYGKTGMNQQVWIPYLEMFLHDAQTVCIEDGQILQGHLVWDKSETQVGGKLTESWRVVLTRQFTYCMDLYSSIGTL